LPGDPHDDVIGKMIDQRLPIAGCDTCKESFYQRLVFHGTHGDLSPKSNSIANHWARRAILPIDSMYDIYSLHEFEIA
jgi:hypothetical protein